MGVDHEGILQNLWTLNRIIVLVTGLECCVDVEPDPTTGRPSLMVRLKPGYEPVARQLQRLLLFGRAGNAGNTGGLGLDGGEGFEGKPIVFVRSGLIEPSSA